MTEPIRRPRTRPSPADADVIETEHEETRGPVVEIAVPGTSRLLLDGLVDAIRPMVDTLAEGLGLSAPREVVAGESAGTFARLSIDGRPAATVDVTRSQDGPDSAQLLAGALMHGVTGRLPLLLGAGGQRTNAAYLVDLGLAVSPQHQTQPVSVGLSEDLVSRAEKPPTELYVSSHTLRRAGPRARGAMREAGEAAFRASGAGLPNVRLHASDMADGLVRLSLNQVRLPVRTLGDGAGWEDVVGYFASLAGMHLHWFVWPELVSRRIAYDVRFLYPELVEIIEGNFSNATVTACMRELVRSGGTVRNLPRIMWLMLEQESSRAESDVLRLAESPLVPKQRADDAVERDPVVLAARIRKLAAEEAWRLGSYVLPADPARIPPELEDELLTAGSSEAAGIAAAGVEWAVVDALLHQPSARTLVTRRMEAISPVRAVVQALPSPPRVICSHELPPDYDLASVPTIRPYADVTGAAAPGAQRRP